MSVFYLSQFWKSLGGTISWHFMKKVYFLNLYFWLLKEITPKLKFQSLFSFTKLFDEYVITAEDPSGFFFQNGKPRQSCIQQRKMGKSQRVWHMENSWKIRVLKDEARRQRQQWHSFRSKGIIMNYFRYTSI